MAKHGMNKWIMAFFIVAMLTILSIFTASFLSVFTENDFNSIGNTAVIAITGTIVAEEDKDFLFEDVTSSDEIRKLIRRADRNSGIKAIIFEINSPGGSAVASDEISQEIKKINKTTVAWIREIGTSGAYWVASSADYIIANRMSITGSIGVTASYLGFYGFLAEHNVTYERLVSGRLKDIGSPLKEPTVEEREVFEKILASIHKFFVEEIVKNRNLKKNDVEKLATGAFYLGVEAKELALVDELGSREEVINYIEKQIGEEASLVRYKKEKGFLSSLSRILNGAFFYAGRGIGSSIFMKARLNNLDIIT